MATTKNTPAWDATLGLWKGVEGYPVDRRKGKYRRVAGTFRRVQWTYRGFRIERDALSGGEFLVTPTGEIPVCGLTTRAKVYRMVEMADTASN